MQYCTLEKEGFLGTFYERETPSEKAGMSRMSLGAACTLLCANGKIVQSDAASAGENDDDGSKIPKGLQPCLCGQLDEAG